MPKKVQLAEHFSTSELKNKYQKSKDSVESRREATPCLRQGICYGKYLWDGN
ncbi:MAG: hypothetical protein N5P05_003017 [Chroococcopsis gigantea SAG 12.99]|jgi:hypothetical protein|nr:hypothetical protein [Chroococcopsis gigantea SAG 12.99]